MAKTLWGTCEFAHAHSLRISAAVVLAIATVGTAAPAQGQAQVRQAQATVRVPVGKSRLVENPAPLRRVSISEPSVAEAVVVSPSEVLINGKAAGTTSLLIWGSDGSRRFYSVEVTVDAESVDEHLASLFPDEEIDVTATPTAVILSGSVSEASVGRRAMALAEATGATVIDNLQVPAPRQILLQVRVAEVNRSAFEDLGIQIQRFNLDDGGYVGTGRFIPPPSGEFPNNVETINQLANIFLFETEENVQLFIRALKGHGLFRSLAEPNLLALDGQEASFLAGGEFPYPVVQGGDTDAISIQFKEFGVRLNFVPVVTNAGNINLKVAPEVSQLDFANGLQISGFQIPALLSRKAETTIELRDGQTFAIAGLIDNSITENIDKIPILGDIPILGALFTSKELEQGRTELLVLVTPHLVEPSNTAPPVPTGEPRDWDWKEWLEEPMNNPGGGR